MQYVYITQIFVHNKHAKTQKSCRAQASPKIWVVGLLELAGLLELIAENMGLVDLLELVGPRYPTLVPKNVEGFFPYWLPSYLLYLAGLLVP